MGRVCVHHPVSHRFEFRPSMSKFEATSSLLEVCEVAKFAPGYLNRQVITLLGGRCLGVPDAVFKSLQVLPHSCVKLSSSGVRVSRDEGG